MNNQSPAGFFLRLLAFLNEKLIFLLLVAFFIWNASKSNTLNAIYQGLIILLAIIVFYLLIGMVYEVLFTHYFGGNLGKLIGGLRIKDQSGNKLAFNKILFRQLLSYNFSWLVFGLGFLSILKDPNKQAWHDKTVDSNVFRVQPLLPLALSVFLLTVGGSGYLLKSSFDNFLNSPAKQEVLGLVAAFQEQSKNNKSSANQEISNTNPAQTKTTAPVQPTDPGYTQTDIKYWQDEISYINQDLANIPHFLGNSSYDQGKLNQMSALLDQRKPIANQIYAKMVSNQTLTAQDDQAIKTYDQLTSQYASLANQVFPRQ